MNTHILLDSLAAVCLIAGASMSLAAAVGLFRFPDLLSRMHSATKPQVLGLLLLLIAMAIQLRSWAIVPVLLVAWVFQLLTAPVSAHMVGRAGYRTKHLRRELLKVDELDEVVAAAAESPHRPNPDVGTGEEIRTAEDEAENAEAWQGLFGPSEDAEDSGTDNSPGADSIPGADQAPGAGKDTGHR